MIREPESGWIEGVAIMIAVVLVLTITAGNDWSKERKFNRILLLASDKKCKVLRDGKVDQISSWDLVVGDVVVLAPGDEVPADGVFLRAGEPGDKFEQVPDSVAHISIDESPLTGETLPMKKSTKKPFLFSGCQVSDGSGLMLATGVGASSSAGKIQAILNEHQKSETTLQRKLKVLAVQIGKVGFSAGVLTFLGLTCRWIYDVSKKPWQWSSLEYLVEFLVTSVTVIVVAVPEGECSDFIMF